MDFRYTRHQVPRGAHWDATSGNKVYLFKYVTTLRLTYQIRLLTFRAKESRMVLVLKLPKACEIHPTLRAYLKEFSELVRVERF